jgi:hypothetical protein
VTVGQPVFGFAERTVPEELPVVRGAKIVVERRRVFPAIPKERCDSYNYAENEDEGDNDQQFIGKVGHGVFLCIGFPHS